MCGPRLANSIFILLQFPAADDNLLRISVLRSMPKGQKSLESAGNNLIRKDLAHVWPSLLSVMISMIEAKL
jgi:hypothetical protein